VRRAELALATAETRREDQERAARAQGPSPGADWGEGNYAPFSRLVEPAAEALVAAFDVGPGQRLLDVGAGDGNVALAAVRRGAEAVACDISQAMVERGRARTRAAGRQIEWRVADAQALPFGDESFDCVASSFGVIHAADPRRASSELNRVVRPGGHIGITAWAPTGVLGRALALAADRLARPEARTAARWGRYEDAYRRFGFHAEFEVRDEMLPLEAASQAEAIALLLEGPGPLRAVGPSRAVMESELSALLSARRTRSRSDFAAMLDYVLITARKPSVCASVSAGRV
jgi:ubiquinone/menaquinone biosynthesis C-methylase UbiE